MKYVYTILILALLVGGYFVVTGALNEQKQADAIPEGYHMMEDGTLMRNDAGMEGMGAMAEIQQGNQAEVEDGSNDGASMELDMNLGLDVDTNAKVFEVRGVNHSFDVKEIRVNVGDTVTINFESSEGFHDWVVDEFNAATDQVQPGTPTSVTFVADEAGTFEYYCSVGSHRANGMVGSLIVE